MGPGPECRGRVLTANAAGFLQRFVQGLRLGQVAGEAIKDQAGLRIGLADALIGGQELDHQVAGQDAVRLGELGGDVGARRAACGLQLALADRT